MVDATNAVPIDTIDEPQISIEFDGLGPGMLTIRCQRCGVINRREVRMFFIGSEITCDCGFVFKLTKNSVMSAPRSEG